MKKAIYAVRDRKLPKEIAKRIPSSHSGQSFIPPGWRNLVRLLDREIAEIHPDYALTQVKSKYGSLRYYVPLGNEEVQNIINKYSALSENTCEVCGQPAKKYSDTRWIITRCESHKE